jgi:hypothetical protein
MIDLNANVDRFSTVAKNTVVKKYSRRTRPFHAKPNTVRKSSSVVRKTIHHANKHPA